MLSSLIYHKVVPNGLATHYMKAIQNFWIKSDPIRFQKEFQAFQNIPKNFFGAKIYADQELFQNKILPKFGINCFGLGKNGLK